ncbi:hypothetical protein GCM10023224_05290 [Streptomonospora halophila]|uniref:Uncharacterized protein n=1 Tax=Streptomonospora halophila TaxID=427369 RepID=A0ABP9G5D6_9ACTN
MTTDLLRRAAQQARGDSDPRWHAVADWLDKEAAMHIGVAVAAERIDVASQGRVRLVVRDDETFPGSTLPQALAVARLLVGEEGPIDE